MKLPPLCERIYLVWIDQDTWYTPHPLDKRRFYDFVKVFVSNAKKDVSASELKEDIISRYKGKLDDEYLEESAEYYSSLFDELVEYARYSNKQSA